MYPTLSRREALHGLLAAGAAATTASFAHRRLTLTRPAAHSPRSPHFLTPIQQVVIAIRENHTYDSIFGLYPGGNGLPTGLELPRCADEIDPDPNHTHTVGVVKLDEQGATSAGSRCTYYQEDVPGYWDLADQFTLCDNYYTEILAPSMPNHLVLISGRVIGVPNPAFTWTCIQQCFELPTLADRADSAGLTWRDYTHLNYAFMRMIEHLRDSPNLVDSGQFLSDCAAGTLANVSWLRSYDPYSEHPPYSMADGHNWIMRQINGFLASPQWESSAMILVWDDWGGFYDHVRPPNVETNPTDNTQMRYGYRSGCLVISPYAKPGYISHILYSHASVLALVEALFGLRPLTNLDAQANNLLDCFDFTQRPIRPRPVPYVRKVG